MTHVTLTALMGIPGCGKSHACENDMPSLVPDSRWGLGPVVVRPDDIRKELTGSQADQSRNSEVFETAHLRTLEALRNGSHVVFDATNVTAMARTNLLGAAKAAEETSGVLVAPVLVVFRVSHHVAYDRNEERKENRVPSHVMLKMVGQYERSLGQIGYEPWRHIIFREGAAS